jgi:hypothetical protein
MQLQYMRIRVTESWYAGEKQSCRGDSGRFVRGYAGRRVVHSFIKSSQVRSGQVRLACESKHPATRPSAGNRSQKGKKKNRCEAVYAVGAGPDVRRRLRRADDDATYSPSSLSPSSLGASSPMPAAARFLSRSSSRRRQSRSRGPRKRTKSLCYTRRSRNHQPANRVATDDAEPNLVYPRPLRRSTLAVRALLPLVELHKTKCARRSAL